jgi:alkylation response protein AidB-like acyl-CoA dehydrogenase
MDFSFTEEQSMLRDTIASYLADNYSFDQRRAALGREPFWRPDVWSAFADELGILGAAFPEAQGGLGGGYTENMVVMEELGKALVVEPYLGTVVIGGGFLKHGAPAGAEEMIGQIIAGKAIFAFAYAEPQGRYNIRDLKTTARKDGAGYVLNGHKAVVEGAAHATHLLVTARTGGAQRDAGGVALLLIPADAKGITRRDYLTVHGASASEVYFENVAVGAEHVLNAEALPLIEAVVDEATAAVCAEACGVLKVLHAQTLDYAKQRKQFGKAIGDFQVIQHRLVDMFMEVEQAVSMTMMATLKLDTAERSAAVSMAKAKVGKGAKFVGQNAVQVHGGIGITQELAVGHYFKRATLIENLFGSVDFHLSRYEGIALAA